jgi:hypothetical protein
MRTNVLHFSLMLLILVLSSCLRRAPSVHVQNPHGFKGEANISCVSTADKRVTIQIDANGMAAAPCPLRESPVFIDEDGKSTEADNVEWLKTGDGIVVGMKLEFR